MNVDLNFAPLDDTLALYTIIYSENWEEARNFLCSTQMADEDLRRFVLFSNNEGRTLLTMKLQERSGSRSRISIQHIPADIVVRLIEIGGRDLVTIRNQRDNRTPLHYACMEDGSTRRVIEALINYGGMDLVYAIDRDDMTALHYVCNGPYASTEVVLAMLISGGKDLVMAQDSDGRTALHYACLQTSPANVLVVPYLINQGGFDLVFMTDTTQRTALHLACCLKCPSIDIIRTLVQNGGTDLVRMQDLMQWTALDFVKKEENSHQIIAVVFLLRMTLLPRVQP